MMNCFAMMAGYGPGWGTVAVLIAATAALTYLLTKCADQRAESVAK